tara:strand:+ start:10461 stop:12314 length:1854 start_codon:yes stop_codon:yes gene_type:complete
MALNLNPYGSTISRSNLFVYDPTKLSQQFIDKGLEKQEKIFGEIVATRKKEVQYANDILNNLGALKDQAELEHNNFINARVDTLIEQVKGNMTKKGKLGLVSFNFNNPEFQLQLRQGVNQLKRGINNSKLLKDQYDDFVKFLNINKDVVSNQVELLNRASQNVTNPVNIFTANDVTTSFTNLKNEAIDERKFISQTAQDILQQTGVNRINYETTDAEGKPVTVTGEFNKSLYILDKAELNILKDANGKPLINNTYVETVKEEILKSTNIKSVTDWLNNPNNNEEFVRMLTSDLDVKIQTELDRLRIIGQKQKNTNEANKGKNDDDLKSFAVSDDEIDGKKYFYIQGIGTQEIVSAQVKDAEGNIKSFPIEQIIGLGKDEDDNKIIRIQVGNDVKVLQAKSVVAEINPNVDSSETNLEISQEEIDRLYEAYYNNQIDNLAENERPFLSNALDVIDLRILKGKDDNDIDEGVTTEGLNAELENLLVEESLSEEELKIKIEELESKKESSTNKILSPEDNDLLKKYTDDLNEIERQKSSDEKTLDESEKQLDKIKNKIADFEKVLNDTLNKTKTNKSERAEEIFKSQENILNGMINKIDNSDVKEQAVNLLDEYRKKIFN